MGFGETPVSYQLWFLRDLIYFVLASPVIYVIASNRMSFVAVSIPLVLIYTFSLLDNDYFSFTALFYFFIGSGLSFFSGGLFIFDRFRKVLLAIFIGLFTVSSLMGHDDFSSPILRITVLIGVFAIFSLTGIKRCLVPSVLGFFSSLSIYSFWMFIIHEPLLTIIFKISNFTLGIGMGFFSYFIIPLCVFILSVTTYKFFYKYFPLFLKVLNGGRIAS
ncbi:hypothetical protein BZG75_15130 [Salinivibrio sp. AR640]|nr:hypothetical protein BZG75_15130 [Salinivibrio sp. AR640]